MTLPLLLSVPHGGRRVPSEVADRCLLTPAEIARDGDEGAAEIYALEGEVAVFVATDVARAIVDLNRAPDDLRADGVVKTHTCFQEPVYRSSLDEATVELLLELYYHPYHRRLEAAAGPAIRLGIDCHTMLAEAPPIGPDPGRPRPRICLSNADGTCPRAWLESLASCLRVEFGDDVRLNDPFTGGYITRRHAAELPWMQLEMSRAPFMSYAKKRAAVRSALRVFCEGL